MNRRSFLKAASGACLASGLGLPAAASPDDVGLPSVRREDPKLSNRRPYAGVDWTKARQVNTTSHGHCVYDWIYLVMSCGSDLASGGMSAQADDAGWCKCGASYTPPYLDGYLCRDGLGGDGIGMQCWRKDGCACGDITCPYEEFCAAPGRCVDRDEMVDLYLESERR